MRTGLRWRIEHAQHLNPADIPRFGELGVIASMQGCHATSDGPFVVTRLGKRRAQEGAYAWQPLLKSGAMIVNGSDVPVEDISPIRCFYSSVTRKMADGRLLFPEHCMTRQQALRSYTLDAAYAGFEEGPQRLAHARQAGRRGGPLQGHHDGVRSGDPGGGGLVHDRGRQGALRAGRPGEYWQAMSESRELQNVKCKMQK